MIRCQSLSFLYSTVADPGGDPREQRNPPFAQNVRIEKSAVIYYVYSYVSPIPVDLLINNQYQHVVHSEQTEAS